MYELLAVSPIDGRYRKKVEKLSDYFSESALIKYRIKVEIEYFIALCKLPLPELKDFNTQDYEHIRQLYKDFSVIDAQRVKEIESTTNHDVKAVEYYIKEKFKTLNLERFGEFIHFGLTSQDINNTATPLLLQDAMNEAYYPTMYRLMDKLYALIEEWKEIPMLARTHGQPASPTRLGKELAVFAERLEKQLGLIKLIPYSAKFGGATGNFNAHFAAYGHINWVEFGNSFVNHILGLERSQTTTQIEHYDNLAAIFDGLKRINTIMIDMSRDIWSYISMEYFRQKIKENEVGSSAMPHKVNPIDFENAEGNLGIANAIFGHLSEKLPVSRLQRDLTDSTVLRNVGVPVAHSMLALKSLLKGFDKLLVNSDKINADLENNWSVVAEAIQTILRRESYPNPFEALKKLTRKNERIDKKMIADFIDKLEIRDEVKEEMRKITPYNYTGI